MLGFGFDRRSLSHVRNDDHLCSYDAWSDIDGLRDTADGRCFASSYCGYLCRQLSRAGATAKTLVENLAVDDPLRGTNTVRICYGSPCGVGL